SASCTGASQGDACDDDAADHCTGTSATTCVDVFRASSFTCRASAGQCDVAESCTGSSGACPADAKSTAQCRATGDCDIAESCNGVSNDCPADSFKPMGTVCRGSAGVCDVAETCSGTSPACPADA